MKCFIFTPKIKLKILDFSYFWFKIMNLWTKNEALSQCALQLLMRFKWPLFILLDLFVFCCCTLKNQKNFKYFERVFFTEIDIKLDVK